MNHKKMMDIQKLISISMIVFANAAILQGTLRILGVETFRKKMFDSNLNTAGGI